jgi:hypothetical protein
MLRAAKLTLAATILLVAGLASPASAHGRLYPLTRCGPNLAYLCPIHGYFDAPPFRYKLAVHPSCIQTVAVETPNGVERRRAVVCGAPDRPMVWWW